VEPPCHSASQTRIALRLGYTHAVRVLMFARVFLHRRAIGRLQFTDQFGQGFHCTGSMIDSTSILTAGHCVHGGKYGSWFTNFKWTPGQDGSRKPYGTVSAGTRPTW
jgi:hypothetical protein